MNETNECFLNSKSINELFSRYYHKLCLQRINVIEALSMNYFCLLENTNNICDFLLIL